MLKNEVLDVQKLANTAENEPLQIPEIWKTMGLWVPYGCSEERCTRSNGTDLLGKHSILQIFQKWVENRYRPNQEDSRHPIENFLAVL